MLHAPAFALLAFALLAFALALPATAAPPVAPMPPDPGSAPPPEAMIDFLGRRRLCLELGEDDSHLAPATRRNQQRERARLACASLEEEERGWRARSAGDPNALAWLDLDPLIFELPDLTILSNDGPPPAWPRRVRQSGLDDEGRHAFAVEVDARGERVVRFAAAFADGPERRFTLPAARLPGLALGTLRVFLKPEPPHDRLILEMRFGWPRGYCNELDGDDRPRLIVTLDGQGGISAEAEDRTNCGRAYFHLPVSGR